MLLKSLFNHLIVVAIVFMGTTKCWSQDNTIYQHHFLHQITSNPATAGSEFFPVVALTNQKQWLGIEHSPFTLIASASMRIGRFDFYDPKMFINKTKLKSQERVGIGFAFYSDRNGPVVNRGINLAYAYHIPISSSRLAFGLSGSAGQTQMDESIWDPIQTGDPLLGNSRESFIDFNANFGVYFYGAEYFAGFAANHIIPLESKSLPREKIKPDFIVSGGYLFRSKEKFKIEPSVHLRYLDYDFIEYDLMAKLYIQHIHWVTIAYRSYNALALFVGFKIQKITFSYSYEANLSSMIKYSLGTHGLHLGLNMGARRLEGF